MGNVMLLLVFLALSAASLPGPAAGQSQARFSVKNNCSRNGVLIFTAGPTGSTPVAQWGNAFGTSYTLNSVAYNYTPIASGATATFDVPLAGAVSGNMVLAYGCPEGSTGFDGQCIINYQSTTTHTIAEITAGCAYGQDDARCNDNPGAPKPSPETGFYKIAPQDSIDVSAVNGYTLPIKFEATNLNHTDFQYGNRSSLDTSMLDLASCAKEFGYFADELQTLGLAPGDAAAYPLTYQLLANPAYASGISLANTVTVGPTTYWLSCSNPHYWLTNTTVGNPPNPTLIPQNAGAGTAGADLLPPNTTDWYGCSNHGNQAICTDASTTCTCTYPGCRGAQCSKGIRGNYQGLTIVYTNYVKKLKEMKYLAYTWPYDDGQGGFGIAWTGDHSLPGTILPEYLVTFCPSGGDPVKQGQKWAWSASDGTCMANDAGTYNSLHECLTTDPTPKAQFYRVPDVILGFPTAGIPNRTFNYCVWNGGDQAGATGPMDYDACVASTYPSSLGGALPPYLLLE
ncbi:hypothetical protein [Solidesulfovibrio sp.]